MLPILVAAAIAIGLLVAGGLLTEVGPWYYALRKPRWNPPNWLFGPAWTLILGLAAWSGALAWSNAPDTATLWRVGLLFGANAVLHFLWSPIFFKARRPDWALAEVVVLWASILALMVGLAPFSPLSSLLLVPYLLWVSFSVALNWTIVRMNAPFGPDTAAGA